MRANSARLHKFTVPCAAAFFNTANTLRSKTRLIVARSAQLCIIINTDDRPISSTKRARTARTSTKYHPKLCAIASMQSLTSSLQPALLSPLTSSTFWAGV